MFKPRNAASIAGAATLALAVLSAAAFTTASHARDNRPDAGVRYDCRCTCKAGLTERVHHKRDYRNISTCSKRHFGKSCKIGNKTGEYVRCLSLSDVNIYLEMRGEDPKASSKVSKSSKKKGRLRK